MVWNQQTFWNLTFETPSGQDINLSGVTIEALITRRQLSNIVDTRNGLTFDISNYTPTPPAIPLTVTNIDATNGSCTLVIDASAWGLMASDPELKIDANDPVGYSGRVKVSFPAVGTTPADDVIIFLLFLVRSDGVIVL